MAPIHFEDDRAQEIAATAIQHVEDAQKAVSRMLTWVEQLPVQMRDDYTRASNALEIASCRLRGVFRDLRPIVELL